MGAVEEESFERGAPPLARLSLRSRGRSGRAWMDAASPPPDPSSVSNDEMDVDERDFTMPFAGAASSRASSVAACALDDISMAMVLLM